MATKLVLAEMLRPVLALEDKLLAELLDPDERGESQPETSAATPMRKVAVT